MPSYSQYKRQIAVVDAKDDNIQWITVRGNHIPIKEGQTKEEAVKSFIEGKKKNLVENHKSLVEAMNLEEKGYFNKDPKKRDSITQSAIEMGKEEKNLEELMEFGVKEANNAKPESKYDPEFEVVRKNALANGNIYGGKYTQKSKAEAYKEYKNDTSSKENMKKANEFVNGKPESSKSPKKAEIPEDMKGMLESVMAYGGYKLSPEDILSSNYHGKYLKKYVDKYGEKKVKEAIKDMQSHIDHIEHDVHTDSEGVSYNSIVWKEDKANKNITLKTNNPVAKVNPNKWGKEWNKRANKPETLGEAAKNATKTAMSLNKKAKTEANYTVLEIAYNDVSFNKSPDKNKADMLKAISNSGAKNIEYMKQTISNMPETAFESHNAFRKGLKDTSKWHIDWFKRANKPVELGKLAQTATKIVEKTKELKKLDKKA